MSEPNGLRGYEALYDAYCDAIDQWREGDAGFPEPPPIGPCPFGHGMPGDACPGSLCLELTSSELWLVQCNFCGGRFEFPKPRRLVDMAFRDLPASGSPCPLEHCRGVLQAAELIFDAGPMRSYLCSADCGAIVHDPFVEWRRLAKRKSEHASTEPDHPELTKIMDLLRDHQYRRWDELADALGVNEKTIRRRVAPARKAGRIKLRYGVGLYRTDAQPPGE